MLEPQRVAACVVAMREAVSIPVTVKTRIGVDQQDSYEALSRFVSTLTDAGLECLIVHARKAWLTGLSPKQNREVPPLRYAWVYQIKKDYPSLEVHINGGIKTLDAVQEHLEHVDGVMIGREAYYNPYILIPNWNLPILFTRRTSHTENIRGYFKGLSSPSVVLNMTIFLASPRS